MYTKHLNPNDITFSANATNNTLDCIRRTRFSAAHTSRAPLLIGCFHPKPLQSANGHLGGEIRCTFDKVTHSDLRFHSGGFVHSGSARVWNVLSCTSVTFYKS
ncbi:hypothetical protein Q8A67_022159 [Cirrhinus molitorella]|uniref:Uncharacterized protein n=1 Tax=Cirrhinus molitorella TaxID=172907 RepID=A0AA88P869_9TELE|nr:hypothetical protein Q8A67_022159 [Cirrhinus molitorella]